MTADAILKEVELINNSDIKKSSTISVLIGDDDLCTIAAVRREIVCAIKKWSDFNHANKASNNYLNSFKMSHKLIEYFCKGFSYVIKSNKDNAEKVKASFESKVSHAFGDHDSCGDWCQNQALGNLYTHKGAFLMENH